MKAEERHRLHENDLQRLAETARLRSQPFLERYGMTILFAMAAVIILTAIAIWWIRSSRTTDAPGWSSLNMALGNPQSTGEDFANIADSDEFSGTAPAKWARLLEAEARLDTGIEQMFTDRAAADQELAAARKAFEELAEGTAVSPEHAVRVRFGQAKLLEVTSDGDLQPAIDLYDSVAKDFPGTVYEQVATERIEALSQPDAKAFYAWFSKQSPKPVDPLQRPDDGNGIPENPFSGMIPPAGMSQSASDSPENAASSEGNVSAPILTPPAEAPAESEATKDEPASEDSSAKSEPVSEDSEDSASTEPESDAP